VAGTVGMTHSGDLAGVLRQEVGSNKWEKLSGGLPQDAEVHAITVHPTDRDTVLVGSTKGLFRSTNRGGKFERLALPDAEADIWSVLVHPKDPRRIYAGASPIDVYRSDDGGASWRKLATPRIGTHCSGPFASRVMRFAQHPARPDEIYAALEINGVMHSTDGGETWQDCSAGLIKLAELPHLKSKIVSDTTAEGMLDGHAVAINPAEPDAAIVALRMGLFETRDQGRTWNDMEVGRFSPTTYGRDVKASAAAPNSLYAALSVAAASKDGGLYRSDDGGKSWRRFDKVQVHGTIMSIGLHASDPDQVYIGARYEGEIFGTRDGGKSWQAMPLPGEVQHIYSVACG
jgi:photosystem II stability/assembly factor-like uncharacterized protein